MKTYYKRNTHSPRGNPIKFDIDTNKSLFDNPRYSGLVIHMLLSDNLMTFEQISSACADYAKQEQEECLTDETVAYSLCIALSLGLAKAISI